jgi:rod shape-determining protein MreD
MDTLIAIVGILAAGALQSRLPTLQWLGDVRLEFLPAVVVYAVLTMRRRGALALALIAGLMQDAFSAAPFGITALAYGICAILMTTLREALDRDLPWVQFSAGALTSMAVAIFACFVISISVGTVFKMIVVASLSGAVTVMSFFLFDYARMTWGYE